MRVLHVAQALSRKFGGVQTVVLDLTRFQVRAGIDVEVATTNVDTPAGPGVLDVPTDRAVDVEGAKVHYFPVQFRALLYSRQLRAFLDRETAGFDIVHVHGMYRFPMTYAAYRARTSGVPYVLSPHGSLDPYLFSKSSRSVALKRLYERWFDFPNFHAAGGIHYTTEEERKRVAFLGLKAPTFVVPNGIDWSRYADLPPRGDFRRAHGLDDEPVILFLGRIHFKKGFDLLIPAFERLGRDHPDARLVIAGPELDGYGQEVRHWVRKRGLDDRVLFVGHLDGDDVTRAYVDADLFVLPSYTENFGMTVVEAMACGLPVVISDQVNIHAEVAAAGAGLVTRCDADETARALCLLLEDANRHDAMAKNARYAARSVYDWPAVVESFKSEYAGIIERAAETRAGQGLERRAGCR